MGNHGGHEEIHSYSFISQSLQLIRSNCLSRTSNKKAVRRLLDFTDFRQEKYLKLNHFVFKLITDKILF